MPTSTDMSTVSRRRFLALVAGGAALAWSTWTCGGDPASPPGHAARASPAAAPLPYVDHDGWMLTPGEREKIGDSPMTPAGEPAP